MYAYPCMTTARPMIPFSVSYTDGPIELIEYRRRGGFASKRQGPRAMRVVEGSRRLQDDQVGVFLRSFNEETDHTIVFLAPRLPPRRIRVLVVVAFKRLLPH